MEKSVSLAFSVSELNVILNALASQPYGQVFALVEKIQKSAEAQLKEQNNEPRNETTAG